MTGAHACFLASPPAGRLAPFRRALANRSLTVTLFLKNLLYLVVVPGFFLGWAPLRWFERNPRWPTSLGPLQWLAIALAVAAGAAYLHCAWLFARRGQGTPAFFAPPQKLIQRGLYRWLRNPMDLALIALIAAEALYLQSWHIAVYGFCLSCLMQVVVVMQEESALSFRFGAMYEDYRRAVPRWIARRPKPRDEGE